MASAADLEQTAKEVAALGRRVHAAQADVRDLASLQRALDAGVAELGRLDIVIANELSEQTWGQMIDINLSGVWRTCKAAIPQLIAGGRGGSIILTSSVAGLRPFDGLSHYVAAKHGVVGLMKTLAHELAPHRIRVNSVHPTQVDTPMLQNEAMYHVFCPDVAEPTRQDLAAASGSEILMPIDWVESVDVSNAVLFLASDEARYITGVALPVDGGTLIL
jgi:NAD(P)-dependent dehydrogenase (short-subunit alcohol dehydrogenase family)